MSEALKRTIPLAVTTIIALLLLITYFFGVGSGLEDTLLSFAVVIATASLGLGILNLTFLHVKRVQKQTEGQWHYSAILLVCMVLMLVIGFAYGRDSDSFSLFYDATIAPLGATLMSLFIVWITPGFYRAVRARNIPTTLLIIAMIIVLIGGSPIGSVYLPMTSTWTSWLNSVVSMGAQRGLKITIGLGLIVMSIRIIIGREKTYMRKEARE